MGNSLYSQINESINNADYEQFQSLLNNLSKPTLCGVSLLRSKVVSLAFIAVSPIVSKINVWTHIWHPVYLVVEPRANHGP